ncbi:MAG: DUF1015 domain-containing protein [Flammeovirgaceae bacterium]
MAEIKPFKAWRYHQKLSSQISELCSPLFDVVSEKQRRILYSNPLNSIHLSVPSGNEPIKMAMSIWKKWRNEGIVVQEDKPSIYVYYQYFSLPLQSKILCRKGFISFVKASFHEEKSILLHENTIPLAVNDRFELLKATELNVSPTHGLYSDNDFVLEPYMDEAILNPLYDVEDYQGVRNVIAKIDNPVVVEKFVRHLKDKTIILADGHHRFESSVMLRKEKMKNNPRDTGKEPYHYHLMYLTNMEATDLRILPTHRLLHGLNPELVSKEYFLEKAKEYFHVIEIPENDNLNEIIVGKKWAFGVVLKDSTFKLRLKEDSFPKLDWKFPVQVKEMDLTIMHYFIIEKILGIKGKDQRTSNNISFERNFHHCLSKVEHGEAQIALITNEISIQQVKNICYSGYTLPQKSTYFYPKVVCGLVYGSIAEEDWK